MDWLMARSRFISKCSAAGDGPGRPVSVLAVFLLPNPRYQHRMERCSAQSAIRRPLRLVHALRCWRKSRNLTEPSNINVGELSALGPRADQTLSEPYRGAKFRRPAQGNYSTVLSEPIPLFPPFIASSSPFSFIFLLCFVSLSSGKR